MRAVPREPLGANGSLLVADPVDDDNDDDDNEGADALGLPKPMLARGSSGELADRPVFFDVAAYASHIHPFSFYTQCSSTIAVSMVNRK